MPAEKALPVILIGCDPEFFVRDKKTKKIISAHNLIPGTKEAPYKVELGAIQVDGIATEININPASNSELFRMNINHVTKQLLAMMNKDGDNYELVRVPVTFFDKEDWEKIPEEPKILGCNPDYNAWTGEANDAPPDTFEYPVMRTAAGHIHIGWCNGRDVTDPMHFMDTVSVAKQMDYYVGLFTLLWDHDARRRNMYGKAGAFRPKPYGMEYRVPSNVWTRTGDLMEYVYQNAWKGMREVFNDHLMEDKFGDWAKKQIDENNIYWLDTPEGRDVMRFMNVNEPPIPMDQRHKVEENKPKPDDFFTPKKKKQRAVTVGIEGALQRAANAWPQPAVQQDWVNQNPAVGNLDRVVWAVGDMDRDI